MVLSNKHIWRITQWWANWYHVNGLVTLKYSVVHSLLIYGSHCTFTIYQMWKYNKDWWWCETNIMTYTANQIQMVIVETSSVKWLFCRLFCLKPAIVTIFDNCKIYMKYVLLYCKASYCSEEWSIVLSVVCIYHIKKALTTQDCPIYLIIRQK